MKNIVLVVLGVFLVAGVAFTLSCGDDDKDKDKDKECSPGSLNCECVSDKCNGDLVCEDNKCVEESVDSDSETEEESDKEPLDTDPTTSTIYYTPDAENNKICAEGVVVGPEDDSGWNSHWGAGFGLDLCKPTSDYSGDKVPLGQCHNDLSRLLGFRLTVTGELPSELRIQFEDNFEGDDEKVGDNGYIVAEKLDEPVDYRFDDAEVFYIEPPENRPELDRELFTGLQIQIASHLNEIEYFDFCIEDIQIIVGEDEPDAGVDDTDTGGGIELSTEVECDLESVDIVFTENNWVDQCTNMLGVQGHWYSYED